MPKGQFTAADLDQQAPTQTGQFTAADLDQSQTSAEQPGAVSRFAGSFARGAGVVSNEEGKNFFRHPIDTAKGMLEAQGSLGDQAYQEFKRGDIAHGFQHGIEYLLPGLGPTLAHAGEQLESGDIAGGTGTTLGAAVPIVAASPEGRAAAGAAAKQAVTAPIRLGARTAEAAVNQKLAPVKPVLKLFTPADEAESVNVKVPGRDVGLAKRGGIAKAMAEPEPAAPVESQALADIPTPRPPTAIEQSAPLGQRGSIAKMMQPEAPPISRPSLHEMLDTVRSQIQQGLGGEDMNPNAPIRQQPSTPKAATDIPEGHTPATSSAVRSYKYDAGAKEFHARMTSGNETHIFGDVSPEEAKAFEAAQSKGKAFQTIKNGHPYVAKINTEGKRIAIKPAVGKR